MLLNFYLSQRNRWSILWKGKVAKILTAKTIHCWYAVWQKAYVCKPIFIWYADQLARHIAKLELMAWNLFSVGFIVCVFFSSKWVVLNWFLIYCTAELQKYNTGLWNIWVRPPDRWITFFHNCLFHHCQVSFDSAFCIWKPPSWNRHYYGRNRVCIYSVIPLLLQCVTSSFTCFHPVSCILITVRHRQVWVKGSAFP